MSLFKGSLRSPAVLSDEAVERYLAAISAEVKIDPLFRRRLRGQVVNRYVATREGTAARERQGHMGTLGRAVLYASFSLAVSVTGILAASQQALPDEHLYPFKRQVEQLRVQILPDRFHAELAAYALSERIGEMDRLADAGDWDGVARLATEVESGYAELLTMDSDSADAALYHHFVVLNGLLDRLPEEARFAIESATDRAAEPGTGSPQNDTSSAGATPAAGTASPKATRSPKPEATPQTDPTRDLEASPRAAGHRIQPHPTPSETKAPKPDDP